MRAVFVVFAACGGGTGGPPLPSVDAPAIADAPVLPTDTAPVDCNLPPSLGTLTEGVGATASYTPPGGLDERVSRNEQLAVPDHTALLFIDVTAGGTEFPTVLGPKSIALFDPNGQRVHVIIFSDVARFTSQTYEGVSGTVNITQIQPSFSGSLVNIRLVDIETPSGCETTIASLVFNTPVQ